MSAVNVKPNLLSDRRAFIFFGSLVFLDLATKVLMRHLGSFETNSGVSFGLLSGSVNSLVVLIWILVCAAFVYRFVRTKSLELLLISAGGVGNLLDRLYFGKVTDWIHVLMWFNIADILIVLGAAYLLIKTLR